MSIHLSMSRIVDERSKHGATKGQVYHRRFVVCDNRQAANFAPTLMHAYGYLVTADWYDALGVWVLVDAHGAELGRYGDTKLARRRAMEYAEAWKRRQERGA